LLTVITLQDVATGCLRNSPEEIPTSDSNSRSRNVRLTTLASDGMMKPGKVPSDLLKRLVYPHLGRRADVLIHARLGEDCAAIDFGEWVAVVTSDPITATPRNLGWLAVHVACNDLATTGAEPVAVLLTLLLDEASSAEDLEGIMRDAASAASALGVEIAGGHTEVTPGVDHTIAVVTAIGRTTRERLISAAGASPGDSLVLTKSAGIEGTAILATDLADRLQRDLDGPLLARAQSFITKISVVPDGLTAARAGATAMHDVTEGGVLGGVWELAEASGCGVELWGDRVPILSETAAICTVLQVDPLALIGSGAMLVATGNLRQTTGALTAAGIPAAEIGVMTDQDRVVVRADGRAPLDPPVGDELWRILEKGTRT